jgi:putative thiamine transport system substrate-binding protein
MGRLGKHQQLHRLGRQTLKERFGVEVVHVKLDDTANAVAKVLAEKAAGKNEGGSVDLIWINGENFASMKRQDLLMAPDWTTGLPNWAYVDHENKPTILTDFTIPTDGLESPWGGAKMVFFHDSARTPADSVPHSSAELLAWAERNPGRFSYPQPPDFIGSSFLKQVLIETIADRSKLGQPVVDATFSDDVAPLFAYLDKLHPTCGAAARPIRRIIPT